MARDYAAEERRRNELARERGFKSRAEQRYQAEQEVNAERAGFDSPDEYSDARREASRWSRRHSHTPVTRYDPNGKDRTPESFGEYYRAMVEPGFKDRWADRPGFRDYLVNVLGVYTDDEFDAKYGVYGDA